MGKKKIVIMPKSLKFLQEFGDNIRLARLRRDLPVSLVAERAMVSRTTVWEVEKGSPSVAIGAYVAVMHSIDGMDKLLANVGKDDPVGRVLQDLKLPTRRRASKE